MEVEKMICRMICNCNEVVLADEDEIELDTIFL